MFLQISSLFTGNQLCNCSFTLSWKKQSSLLPKHQLKVVTKSCQTYYLKGPRIFLFLYNILPLLIAISCPTYILTLIIISQCFSSVSSPRMANCFCSLCQLQLTGNGSPEYHLEKDSKDIFSPSRKEFYVELVKSVLWHCPNLSSPSLSQWLFFKSRCNVRVIFLEYSSDHIISLLCFLFSTAWQINSEIF